MQRRPAAAQVELGGALAGRLGGERLAAGDRLGRRQRALDETPGHEDQRGRDVEGAPRPPRVREHPLGLRVGASGVAHEPGDVREEVRRAGEAELVAAPRSVRDDRSTTAAAPAASKRSGCR